MALVIAVSEENESYVIVKHAGETMRIGKDRGRLVFMANDDSHASPPQSWQFERSDARSKPE